MGIHKDIRTEWEAWCRAKEVVDFTLSDLKQAEDCDKDTRPYRAAIIQACKIAADRFAELDGAIYDLKYERDWNLYNAAWEYLTVALYRTT